MERSRSGKTTRGTKTQYYEVMLDGQRVPFKVTWKTVKNLNLRINSEGTVSVSVPFRTSEQAAIEFVKSHIEFIRKARLRNKPREPQRAMQYVTGEKLRLLGQVVTLQVHLVPAEQVPYVSWNEHEPQYLHMYVKETTDVAGRGKLLVRFLEEYMRDLVLQVGGHVYDRYVAAGYDIPRPSFRVTKAKTRWGSCSPATGRIMINKQLLGMPRRFLEYVMIHEFAHLIHPNHSAQFWAVVAEFLPNWKEIRYELNHYLR